MGLLNWFQLVGKLDRPKQQEPARSLSPGIRLNGAPAAVPPGIGRVEKRVSLADKLARTAPAPRKNVPAPQPSKPAGAASGRRSPPPEREPDHSPGRIKAIVSHPYYQASGGVGPLLAFSSNIPAAEACDFLDYLAAQPKLRAMADHVAKNGVAWMRTPKGLVPCWKYYEGTYRKPE